MQTLNANQFSMAYHDTGRGTPVLFVHGFPLDHTMWEGQIAALAGQYRVIAPDLRGFGESKVSDGVVTMEQMADDLATLLEALEIRESVVLCGLSMGGYIALEFWRKYASKLKSLVLCDTRAAADKPEVAANRLTMAQRVLSEGPQPLVESMLPKLFSPSTYSDQPQMVEDIERIMQRTDPRGIAAAARGMAERQDFAAELQNIRCPTLLLVGADDAFSPPTEMLTLARAIPSAQFHIIPAAGHMAPLEQPTIANAAIVSFVGGLG